MKQHRINGYKLQIKDLYSTFLGHITLLFVILYAVTIESYAKPAAELIKMLFGMWTWVSPRNHILDGVHIPHAKGQF